jgi:hypothetical protein
MCLSFHEHGVILNLNLEASDKKSQSYKCGQVNIHQWHFYEYKVAEY